MSCSISDKVKMWKLCIRKIQLCSTYCQNDKDGDGNFLNHHSESTSQLFQVNWRCPFQLFNLYVSERKASQPKKDRSMHFDAFRYFIKNLKAFRLKHASYYLVTQEQDTFLWNAKWDICTIGTKPMSDPGISFLNLCSDYLWTIKQSWPKFVLL